MGVIHDEMQQRFTIFPSNKFVSFKMTFTLLQNGNVYFDYEMS